jgi:MscS family membrane protein
MDAWIRLHTPALLLGAGPKGLLLWQWLALPPLLVLSWYAGRLLAYLTRRLLEAVTARTRLAWDARLVRRLPLPLALLWSVAVALLLSRALGISAPGQAFLDLLLSAVAIAGFFAVLWSFVDVLGDESKRAPWAAGNPSALSALGLAVRGGKALVVSFACVAVLVQLGYPVASVLAGLGIGGLALALAAQKTVENLFGSIALAVDETIRVGDLVQVENVLGRVEAIGLRSTRIRTLDRTLVSVPNGLLASLRIESLTARDRLRLVLTLGVDHATTPSQLRELIAAIERLLRAHPKLWPDDLQVTLRQLGPGSLDLDVLATFEVAPEEFARLRSDVLLQILEAVERAGIALAAPAPPPAPALQLARERK